MPLSINVGLSRKASKDYQSTGVSINVTAELDQALLARPEELQRQIGDLYAQATAALDQQTAAPSRPQQAEARPATRSNGRPARSSNGNGNGHGTPMTGSQRRAIEAIARRLNIDPEAEARDIIGDGLADLTLRQASELIDHLKSLSPAGNGR